MKKFTLAALIFAVTIANAETINPKEEVIFDKGVCVDIKASYNCTSQRTQILTTGIEWLDKELLLNSGLLRDNQGNRIKSSNKSFAELKTQLKQQYEKGLNAFSVIDDNGKEVEQPKKWFEPAEIGDSFSEEFRTEFIKQKGDTVIFVTYDTGCAASGGSCWDSRREIHFDLKTKKRTHLQGWHRAGNNGFEDIPQDEL